MIKGFKKKELKSVPNKEVEVNQDMTKKKNIEAEEQKPIKEEPKVFTLWSVDGGVGKTTTSVNLAIQTAKIYPEKKIALLDFNLFNPDIDLHLGLSNKDLKHMLDYFLRNEINFENIHNYMFEYEKQKNLHVLTGLYDINFFDKFNIEHFSLMIQYLKKMGFDYIFIDINSSLNIDATFISLCNCDKLIIVGEPQYTCLRNIGRYLDEALLKLGITEDRIELLINRYDSSLISKEEISHILGREDVFFINYSKLIKQGINKSEPFVCSNAKELRKSIESLSNLVKKITVEKGETHKDGNH